MKGAASFPCFIPYNIRRTSVSTQGGVHLLVNLEIFAKTSQHLLAERFTERVHLQLAFVNLAIRRNNFWRAKLFFKTGSRIKNGNFTVAKVTQHMAWVKKYIPLPAGGIADSFFVFRVYLIFFRFELDNLWEGTNIRSARLRHLRAIAFQRLDAAFTLI